VDHFDPQAITGRGREDDAEAPPAEVAEATERSPWPAHEDQVSAPAEAEAEPAPEPDRKDGGVQAAE